MTSPGVVWGSSTAIYQLLHCTQDSERSRGPKALARRNYNAWATCCLQSRFIREKKKKTKKNRLVLRHRKVETALQYASST